MLLHYAEQQVDNVTDVDDIMVCFVPCEDISCIVLIDGIHSIPNEEVWECLQDCEKVEEANRMAQAALQNSDIGGNRSDRSRQLEHLPDKLVADVLRSGLMMADEEANEKMSQKFDREQLQINDSFCDENIVSAEAMNRNNGQQDENLFTYDSTNINRSVVTTGRSGRHVTGDEICFADTANSDTSTIDIVRRIEQSRNQDKMKVELSKKEEPGTSADFSADIFPLQELIYASQPGYRPLQNLAPFITSASIPAFYLSTTVPSQNEAKQMEEIEHRQQVQVHQQEDHQYQHQQRYENEEWQRQKVHHQLQQELKQEIDAVRQSLRESDHIRNLQSSSLLSHDLSELVSSGGNHDGNNDGTNSSYCGDVALIKNTSCLQEDCKPTILPACATPNENPQNRCIPMIDENDPLCFSQWPSWIWSRVFCHPLPLTKVIAGILNA